MTKPKAVKYEKDIVLQAIDEAYVNLPETEARDIEKQCHTVIRKIRNRKQVTSSKLPPMFGFNSALELLAKLGIFLEGKTIPKDIK